MSTLFAHYQLVSSVEVWTIVSAVIRTHSSILRASSRISCSSKHVFSGSSELHDLSPGPTKGDTFCMSSATMHCGKLVHVDQDDLEHHGAHIGVLAGEQDGNHVALVAHVGEALLVVAHGRLEPLFGRVAAVAGVGLQEHVDDGAAHRVLGGPQDAAVVGRCRRRPARTPTHVWQPTQKERQTLHLRHQRTLPLSRPPQSAGLV
mmetsp:Transcript_29414/g.86960  ORF Transcript_29414/g.86960 Transcript_29414/m.86960 type:complete len:204 (+) Transcript_29414:1325-1936(+)